MKGKIITAAIAEAAAVFCLIAFTPLRNVIPGYPNAQVRRQNITNAIKIDSLEKAARNWELYMTNLSRVLRGEARVEIDSVFGGISDVRFISDKSPEELLRQDSLLINSMNHQDKFAVGSSAQRVLPIEGLHFFPPVKGVIMTNFDPALHPGLDVSVSTNSVVCSVLSGTVIFSSWDDNNGFSILVQHSGDLISVYRNNEKALVNVGDKLNAGTPVALAGSVKSLNKGEFLHFELWYQGAAVDPTKYIAF